jgi:hypothetical protein
LDLCQFASVDREESDEIPFSLTKSTLLNDCILVTRPGLEVDMNLRMLLGTLTAFLLCGCLGPGPEFSQEQMDADKDAFAARFVEGLNSIPGNSVELVKSHTLQEQTEANNYREIDYIVIFNKVTQGYEAYDLWNYAPYKTVPNFLREGHDHILGLVDQGDGTYRDPKTGTLFQKHQGESRDLARLTAKFEDVRVQEIAENLQVNYGFSAQKSDDIARFAYHAKHAVPGTLAKKDYDDFAKQTFGSSGTEIFTDLANKDVVSLTKRLDDAAAASGTSVEGVQKFIQDIWLK